MPSNGFFAEGKLQPKSTETWDDLTSSWDSYSTDWFYTPNLPLTFTTPLVDAGRIDNFNYILNVASNHAVDITVEHGKTVDSSGGDIDNATTINVTPNQSLTAVNARYFKFTVSVDYADSAGAGGVPVINSVENVLNAETQSVSINGINSDTLSGSVGVRQIDSIERIGTVTGAVVTAHGVTGKYVTDGYVVSDDSAGETYITSTSDTAIPYITLDKTTTPITLRIYDLNTFGPNSIDCTFDAVLTGLPKLISDGTGSIVEA